MKIRSKLAWTFILLLIFGITSISSYSIVFIRDYLLEEGRAEMERDTRWLAVTAANLSDDENFDDRLLETARTSGYQLAVYDSTGKLINHYQSSDTTIASIQKLDAGIIESLKARENLPLLPRDSDSEVLKSYIMLPDSTAGTLFLQASQFKDQIYEPIKTIRWIIYYGMFISIGLVVVVSIWIARYVTKPITQIKDAAQDIADGDVDREIDISRSDEFGTLATSLNQMASKLRADTEQIKQFAEKQRQFFADITHEIRNPLHTISGALDMLELDELSEEKKDKYITTAKKQTERISHLFKDLKILQRYDSDEYFVELQEFDLSDITEHMQAWYEEKAAKKNVKLNVDQHSCRVVGDPGKIEQVLDNLVSNAIKYTNEGTVNLSYQDSENKVTIMVEDRGIGISEEHLNRLFDRFYRTDKARSRDKGGTGLGLAVVKSILNAHGSKIEVESEVGEGTRFWFELRKA
ncbi:two-component sensor histidine kinase [Aliifodinibius salipaludis]|uniref:histidine kinase n=1 Tax=Fodinibius salipaludis TaxID=2032627 RepID=A0A2A2GCM1_9BACT|nr:HAMP domain-containing sensor histidine kinase [Aliifodinibius salipaludis]PAU94532.1 two-component sensor histidine kinase [Aliifodinibius salipaludis]